MSVLARVPWRQPSWLSGLPRQEVEFAKGYAKAHGITVTEVIHRLSAGSKPLERTALHPEIDAISGWYRPMWMSEVNIADTSWRGNPVDFVVFERGPGRRTVVTSREPYLQVLGRTFQPWGPDCTSPCCSRPLL